MKNLLFYVMGIITGIIFAFVFSMLVNRHKDDRPSDANEIEHGKLEMFDKAVGEVDCAVITVTRPLRAGGAIAVCDDNPDSMVFILPSSSEYFHRGQTFELELNCLAQKAGNYIYTDSMGKHTIPAVRISLGMSQRYIKKYHMECTVEKTMFEKPGECLSRKNFEVQKVLDSGDALAREISSVIDGIAITSDLEVLILGDGDTHFYNHQVIKNPKGKCARQIGTCYINHYNREKVVPIIAFM